MSRVGSQSLQPGGRRRLRPRAQSTEVQQTVTPILTCHARSASPRRSLLGATEPQSLDVARYLCLATASSSPALRRTPPVFRHAIIAGGEQAVLLFKGRAHYGRLHQAALLAFTGHRTRCSRGCGASGVVCNTAVGGPWGEPRAQGKHALALPGRDGPELEFWLRTVLAEMKGGKLHPIFGAP